jgi:hypothetical protein
MEIRDSKIIAEELWGASFSSIKARSQVYEWWGELSEEKVVELLENLVDCSRQEGRVTAFNEVYDASLLIGTFGWLDTGRDVKEKILARLSSQLEESEIQLRALYGSGK